MVFRAVEDETEDKGVESVYRMHDGQEIRVGIVVVPSSVERRIHQEVYGRLKQDKAQKQPVSRASEQALEKAVRRACIAVKWTKGFQMEVVGEASARVYGELLKEPDLKPGDIVTLDDRWTDALKRKVFEAFVPFAVWASDESFKVTGAALQEERELGEA